VCVCVCVSAFLAHALNQHLQEEDEATKATTSKAKAAQLAQMGIGASLASGAADLFAKMAAKRAQKAEVTNVVGPALLDSSRVHCCGVS
jgi:ribosomal protein L18